MNFAKEVSKFLVNEKNIKDKLMKKFKKSITKIFKILPELTCILIRNSTDMRVCKPFFVKVKDYRSDLFPECISLDKALQKQVDILVNPAMITYLFGDDVSVYITIDKIDVVKINV